jgi:excisionase family DNA binding protein
MSETESSWLRTAGAAERAGITAEQMRNLIRQGDGPVCYRVGAHLRFRASDVDAWLESRRVDPEAKAS